MLPDLGCPCRLLAHLSVSPIHHRRERAQARDKVVKAGHALVAKQFGILDSHLRGRDWILGPGSGKRSVIDAYAFPMIRWGIKMLPDGITPWPNIQALHDRLAADASVQKVLAREASK